MRVEKSLHAIVCGRTRKNIRHIEARTDTAIYFPPPFSRILGFIPYGAHRRGDDEFFITGDTQEKINNAKRMLQEIVERTRCHVREIPVSFQKIDGILLDRLDKVRRIMEVNSTYISLPMLGTQRGLIRIQGTEHQHIERTAREMMLLVCYIGLGLGDPADEPPGRPVLQCLLVGRNSRRQQHRCTVGNRHSSNAS